MKDRPSSELPVLPDVSTTPEQKNSLTPAQRTAINVGTTVVATGALSFTIDRIFNWVVKQPNQSRGYGYIAASVGYRSFSGATKVTSYSFLKEKKFDHTEKLTELDSVSLQGQPSLSNGLLKTAVTAPATCVATFYSSTMAALGQQNPTIYDILKKDYKFPNRLGVLFGVYGNPSFGFPIRFIKEWVSVTSFMSTDFFRQSFATVLPEKYSLPAAVVFTGIFSGIADAGLNKISNLTFRTTVHNGPYQFDVPNFLKTSQAVLNQYGLRNMFLSGSLVNIIGITAVYATVQSVPYALDRVLPPTVSKPSKTGMYAVKKPSSTATPAKDLTVTATLAKDLTDPKQSSDQGPKPSVPGRR